MTLRLLPLLIPALGALALATFADPPAPETPAQPPKGIAALA